jgi:hypothetical protein
MSYDLAPEFTPSQSPSSSPPPANPPYSPPSSSPPPANPPYSPPPQSHPPAYSPAPAYSAPPGGFSPASPPPPPPRKRRGLAIGLTVIAAVAVLCGVLSCVFGYPLMSEYGAKISAPSQLPGGLTKDASTSMQASLDALERQFKADVGGTDSVSGFYNDSEGHQVLMVAATGLILFPDNEVTKAFKDTRDGDFKVDELSEQSPGKLGGTVKCGTGKSDDVNMTACMWADHGCAGAVFFLERDIPESVDLFIQIREAVETR